MFTVTSTLIWAVLTGPTDWVCHIGTLKPCVEAVAQSCVIVTWWSGSGGIQVWSQRLTGFLQCFDTVGLVIWPVKIVPEMAYDVSSRTLSLYTTTTHDKTIGTVGCYKHCLRLRQTNLGWSVSFLQTWPDADMIRRSISSWWHRLQQTTAVGLLQCCQPRRHRVLA